MMAPKIIYELIPAGRKNRPGRKLSGPRYITIHDTGNPAAYADAEAHAAYLLTDTAANRPASWHNTVDDREIYQHLLWDEEAYHAGDGALGPGNISSLSIEICENADGDRAKAEANAAWLVAEMIRVVPTLLPFPECLVQHNKWTGKNCPRIIRARSGGWDGFKQLVAQEIARSQQPAEDELTKQLRAELDALAHSVESFTRLIFAPDWFIKEFGSSDLSGLILEPKLTWEGWRTLAISLRMQGYGIGKK